MFGRGLFCLCTGSVLIVGGIRAGSIFQGETLSGRGIEEVSSQRTFNRYKIFYSLWHSSQSKVQFDKNISSTFKHLHLDSGHIFVARSSIPTMVPVNLNIKQIIMHQYQNEEMQSIRCFLE